MTNFNIVIISWAATLYTFSGALTPTECCPVQNSLYIQVSHSRILAALLHGTPAVFKYAANHYTKRPHSLSTVKFLIITAARQDSSYSINWHSIPV